MKSLWRAAKQMATQENRDVVLPAAIAFVALLCYLAGRHEAVRDALMMLSGSYLAKTR